MIRLAVTQLHYAPPRHFFVEGNRAESYLKSIPSQLTGLFQAGLAIRVNDEMVHRAENPRFTFVPH